ncbi:Rha family transcriptional regulator [Clostridium manihotivorum]|uniref:Rha family transcriptional regulator n=1 Tax=Clostridium manihotivorum TaxID=2320868 RepID=UPI0013E3BDE8|nr:Rha family transcriptional regulator [Clostridium manihotivorum]
MNNLVIHSINGVLMVDSREIAEVIGKAHNNLVRDIDGYSKVISQNSNLSSDKFFLESSYITGTGKAYRCYLLTKKGCDMVANKMTGEKGILFSATYIEQFYKMEETLNNQQMKLPTTYREALLQLAQAEEERELLLLENSKVKEFAEQNHEKARAFEIMFEITEGFDVEAVSKAFGIKGLGRNNMFQYLREIGWLTRKNIPRQMMLNKGYIIAKPYTYSKGNYVINDIKTLITEKGVIALYKNLSETYLSKKSKTIEEVLGGLAHEKNKN